MSALPSDAGAPPLGRYWSIHTFLTWLVGLSTLLLAAIKYGLGGGPSPVGFGLGLCILIAGILAKRLR